MGLIVVIIYHKLQDHGNTVELRRIATGSTAGLFFFVVLNMFMAAYMTTLTIFNEERVVVVRE